MKAGILILSFLFVILTIQPAFIKWNSTSCAKGLTSAKTMTKAGCAKSAQKKCSSTAGKPSAPVKQQTEDPCNTCNPFMVCNGCAYITGEPVEMVSPGMLDPDNTNWLIDSSVSSFPADSWHPPELFMRI